MGGKELREQALSCCGVEDTVRPIQRRSNLDSFSYSWCKVVEAFCTRKHEFLLPLSPGYCFPILRRRDLHRLAIIGLSDDLDCSPRFFGVDP